jgi:4-amino-4-deoxy-L-arabinose transferase-like glycosyltransferase
MQSTPEDTRPPLTRSRGLSAVLDFAAASHGRAVALLIVFSLVVLLPGFFRMPPVDRDEPRFAQSTKQMIETGQYVDIRFRNEPRYKKPIGIYWLQAAAVQAGRAAGVSHALTRIWLYRLPSLIGAIGAVLLTYWAALAFVSRRAALLAVLMMASSVLLGIEARLAKTDAMLLFTCVAAMGALARIYLGERRAPQTEIGWGLPAILWTAMAAGILIKGPLIVMFVALCALAVSILDRSARWLWSLRPVAGLIWLALLVLPWFVAIVLKSGNAFFVHAVRGDMLSKIANGQAHGAPPGYYFLLFWVTFWPGAGIAGLAAPALWRRRREPGVQFLLAWVIPSWLVFEAAIFKLAHYVLPLYPAIAILIAIVIDQGGLANKRWMVRGTVWMFLFPALIAVLVPVLFHLIGHRPGFIAWPTAGAAAIFGFIAWWRYQVDGAERSLLYGMIASACIAITVYGVSLPALPALFPSARVAKMMRASRCHQPRLAVTNAYGEPSLVFLLGARTRFTDEAGAAKFLEQGACRYALIDSRNAQGFAHRVEAAGLRPEVTRQIDGINIGDGKKVRLTLFRSPASP